MLNGPPCPSTSRLRLLPCRDPLGWVQSDPPKTCLAHGPVCRLPFPVHTAQLFALFHQGFPYSAQDTQFHPPLKGAMDCAVVPHRQGSIGTRRKRKMMPLSICLGSARLRPLTFGGSASKMIGPMVPKARPALPIWFPSPLGCSRSSSKCSWRNHTPHKPLKVFVRYDFEIVSYCCPSFQNSVYLAQ